MKSTLETTFKTAASENRRIFIPCVMAGYPTMKRCLDTIEILIDAGADILEVIIPFSDPLADGPTIQTAGQTALKSGTTPESVLEMVQIVTTRWTVPVVIMTYFNPVESMGLETFARRAKSAGAAGVLIPDLPPEEADPWITAARTVSLDTVMLAAPTTSPERLRDILTYCRGFLYYVSVTGVTGSRLDVSAEMTRTITKIRSHSSLPVAVGFGVSTEEDVRELGRACDGVIVASAFIRLMEKYGENGGYEVPLGEFASTLRRAAESVEETG